VARSVRTVWPERLPLFFRLSCTDWVDGGWDIEQSVELAKLLKREGVDLIDASSGGAVNTPRGAIPVGPLYQTPFAERIRADADIATSAVGMITEPADAEAIIAHGRADLVVMARELLRDPYWPLFAARSLGAEAPWPEQYQRAAGDRATMRVEAPI
jgi:2,4-dienoyl-CoA reductase-like NADH-dependent reductase (Old Yellow Enzyme family)